MPKKNTESATSLAADNLVFPDFIIRVKSALEDLTETQAAQEANTIILEHESGMLDVALLKVDPDDTDAFHKLTFAAQRVSMLERRAGLLNDFIATASDALRNLNRQAKDRMISAAAKHDALRDEAEITSKLAKDTTRKLSRPELERRSKGWPKLTRMAADQIAWDDHKPENAARFIIKLAATIFADLPALAKAED